jgi:hypothetical protein
MFLDRPGYLLAHHSNEVLDGIQRELQLLQQALGL